MIKTCLITGGAGFIGSHLAASLLTLGFRVIAIDDLSQGSYKNIHALLPHPNFRFAEVDITSEAFAHTLSSFEVDYIFHLASPVGVAVVMKSSYELFDKHETASLVLFAWAAKHKIPLFFASSSEVYGNPLQNNALTELDAKPIEWFSTQSDRFFYGKLKRSMELYLEKWAIQHQIPVTIARFFNVFGENQRADQGMVMPSFVFKALRNESIFIHGDGSQIRSFCPVPFAVEAVTKATLSHTKTEAQLLNVGIQNPISIRDLAQHICDVCDSASEIEFVNTNDLLGRSEAIHTRIPDTTRLNHDLNIVPSQSWDEYLKTWISREKSQRLEMDKSQSGKR